MASDLLPQFRLLLDHIDSEDLDELLLYFRMLEAMGQDVLSELGPRMLMTSAPPNMRMLVMEAAFYHPFEGWISYISRGLRRESDVAIFEVGVRALMRIGSHTATEELRLLSTLIHDPVKQELLTDALLATDPFKAFEHYLNSLFLGSSNPGVANQAAAELQKLVGPDQLESLLVIVYHQDMLISRHALKLITGILSDESSQFLKAYLMECHQDILDDRIFKDVLSNARSLGPLESWSMLLEKLAERLDPVASDEVSRLQAGGPDSGELGLRIIEALRAHGRGSLDTFLMDALVVILQGKGGKLPQLISEAIQGIQARTRRIPHALDTCASGLEGMVAKGLVTAADVVSLLHQVFLAQTGRDVSARVLGALVDPENQNILDSILECAENNLRSAALEAVGARKDDRFLEFLFKACRDPIEDVANRMMLALGGLAGLEPRVLSLLVSRTPEDVRQALRIIRLNQMETLSDQVLAFLDGNQREELSLEAIQTLGGLGNANGALLERMHSGQSLKILTALAEALSNQDRETVLALSARVKDLRHGEAWMLAAEGVIRAWSEKEPMPPEASAHVVKLLVMVWDEHASVSWRMRIIQALDGTEDRSGFFCESKDHLEQVIHLLNACLEDKRATQGWSIEQQNQLAFCVRRLRKMLDVLK